MLPCLLLSLAYSSLLIKARGLSSGDHYGIRVITGPGRTSSSRTGWAVSSISHITPSVRIRTTNASISASSSSVRSLENFTGSPSSQPYFGLPISGGDRVTLDNSGRTPGFTGLQHYNRSSTLSATPTSLITSSLSVRPAMTALPLSTDCSGYSDYFRSGLSTTTLTIGESSTLVYSLSTIPYTPSSTASACPLLIETTIDETDDDGHPIAFIGGIWGIAVAGGFAFWGPPGPPWNGIPCSSLLKWFCSGRTTAPGVGGGKPQPDKDPPDHDPDNASQKLLPEPSASQKSQSSRHSSSSSFRSLRVVTGADGARFVKDHDAAKATKASNDFTASLKSLTMPDCVFFTPSGDLQSSALADMPTIPPSLTADNSANETFFIPPITATECDADLYTSTMKAPSPTSAPPPPTAPPPPPPGPIMLPLPAGMGFTLDCAPFLGGGIQPGIPTMALGWAMSRVSAYCAPEEALVPEIGDGTALTLYHGYSRHKAYKTPDPMNPRVTATMVLRLDYNKEDAFCKHKKNVPLATIAPDFASKGLSPDQDCVDKYQSALIGCRMNVQDEFVGGCYDEKCAKWCVHPSSLGLGG